MLRCVLAEGRAQLSHGVVQSVAAGTDGGPLEVTYRGAKGRLQEVRAKAALVTVPLGVRWSRVRRRRQRDLQQPRLRRPGRGRRLLRAPGAGGAGRRSARAASGAALARVALLFEEQFGENGTSTLAYTCSAAQAIIPPERPAPRWRLR